MRSSYLAGCAALGLIALGCGSSESASSGANEPMIVTNGQFFPGDFPPASPGAPTILGPDMVRNTQIAQGFTGKKFGGATPNTTSSVALRLKGVGTGYWIVPVGVPDAVLVDDLDWSATADFSHTVPAGAQTLQIAAVDGRGRFGTPQSLGLTMLPLLPAGHVVASLAWGNNADLDLHLTTPSGKVLDPKHPNSTEIADSGADAGVPLPGDGVLDRDSNSQCMSDGIRMEDVVWDGDAGAPEPGLYTVRVDMFSACGVPSADFTFTLYVDGVATVKKVGRLLDIQADGGGTGLFVTEFQL